MAATITAVEFVTLDGVMQSPGRADEDDRDGFALGGWAAAPFEADPEAAGLAMRGHGDTAAMLFGHRTYLDLVGHWLDPAAGDNPFTDVLRETPKYVATRADGIDLPFPNSTALAGDAAATVARLKDEVDGGIVILGSGMLVRALAAADLLDRYRLTILPIALGSGARLFDRPAALRIEDSTTTRTGIVVCDAVISRSTDEGTPS